jgi:hypothetical protein
MLSEMPAIERYVARIGKLLPESDWEMAKNDEIVAFNLDLFELFVPTFSIQVRATPSSATPQACYKKLCADIKDGLKMPHCRCMGRH